MHLLAAQTMNRSAGFRYILSLELQMTVAQVQGHVDATVRTMEVSIIPMIRKIGCDLLISLSKW
jgi:hypothetical protein